MDYETLRRAAQNMGEKNDCSVRAVAAVTGKSYETCHEVLRQCGRVNGDGAYSSQIMAALEKLGFKIRLVTRTEIKEKYWAEGHTVSNITVKSVTQRPHHWKGNYICYTNGHVLAVLDGNVIDWTKGKRNFIKLVWEVYPALDELRALWTGTDGYTTFEIKRHQDGFVVMNNNRYFGWQKTLEQATEFCAQYGVYAV